MFRNDLNHGINTSRKALMPSKECQILPLRIVKINSSSIFPPRFSNKNLQNMKKKYDSNAIHLFHHFLFQVLSSSQNPQLFQAGLSELTACILFSGQYPLIFDTYWLPPLQLGFLSLFQVGFLAVLDSKVKEDIWERLQCPRKILMGTLSLKLISRAIVLKAAIPEGKRFEVKIIIGILPTPRMLTRHHQDDIIFFRYV